MIVGVSAGGAPAIRFALDYPDRTLGLVLVGADLPNPGPVSGPTGPPAAALKDPLFWLLTTYARPVLVQLFGLKRAAFKRANRAEQMEVAELFETLLPVEPRRPGIRNDERVTNRAMIDRYDEFPLEGVRVPTLLLHAEDDPLASFEDAERAAKRIPGAELRAYEDGGHLLVGHGDDVERALSTFLEQEIPSANGSDISVSG